MSIKDRAWAFHLAHLSKPIENRPIFQEILKGSIRRILEVGVGKGERSERIIRAAARFRPAGELSFTGIDLFEARRSTHGVGLPLKLVYRMLAKTGAKIRLVPGDAFSGIVRVANSLPCTDLIVISGCQERQLLDKAWYYFPRMMHDRTVVFLQKPCRIGESAPFDRIDAAEISIWSRRARPARAA